MGYDKFRFHQPTNEDAGMSKLVSIWDESYQFNEEEIVFFAETQRELSKPLKVPINEEKIPNSSSTIEIISQQFVDQHCFHPSDLPQDARDIERRLKNKLDLVQRYRSMVLELDKNVQELQNCHGIVKSKSIVMQSLWDGLMTKQIGYSKVIDELQKSLRPYVNYQGYHRVLFNTTNIYSPEFETALSSALMDYKHLLTLKDHHDSALYIRKYELVLQNAIQLLQKNSIQEIETITKRSSSKSEESLSAVLSDVNSYFLISSTKFSKTLDLLRNGMDVGGISDPATNVVNKYFACRSSILHYYAHQALNSAEDNLFSRIIQFTLQALSEEKLVAEKFLGIDGPFSIQYKKMVESFLLPTLKKIQFICTQPSGTKDSLIDTLSREISQFEKFNEDQRRFLNIVAELVGKR